LRYYPLIGTAARLLTVSPRPFSAASVAATERQQVFIKRHHTSVRDAEGLREEHRFMAHLRARGMAVPRVIAAVSGKTAIKLGKWIYEVHEIPPGRDLYEDAISWTPFRSVAHAHSAGQALARLHLASHGYEAPVRRMRQLVAGFTIFAARDPRAEFDRYVASRPALSEYLRTRSCRDEVLPLLEPFHAELLPLLFALTPLWTHNDWHPSNLMWSDGSENAQAVAAIDFGLADRTNAVHDLAHAIERSVAGWLALVNNPARPADVPVHYDHLFALLDGYQSVRNLSREERLALAPMTALCHAEFALSETDYFLSAIGSEEKARMACEGYLVAHARWFHGPGVELLDALRAWAERQNDLSNGSAAR
jgi:Ser/Thr protein kinase RdoA (MazF antagonist)